MPVVFREQGFRFFFYSNEGDPRERPHVHVLKDGAEAKFWVSPDVALAYNHGLNAKLLAMLLKTVESRRAEIERAWNEHFA